MALGTPTDGGAAYSTQNGTSVSPAYPAGINAGDVLVLIIGQKPSTANRGTVSTPSGWTLQSDNLAAGGYGTTLGADTGNTNLFIYTKDTVTGAETGNLSVTVGTNNVCWGIIVLIPSGGGTILYGEAEGSRTTAPTSGTPFATTLTNLADATNLQNGDVALWAMCIPTDVLNNGFTNPSVASSGTTFGTGVELEEPDSGTGTDIGGYVAYADATAGSSTANPSVTVTATGTVTNVRGPISLIRIRELVNISFNAEPGTYTLTGATAELLEDRNQNAESGSYAITGSNAEVVREISLNAESGSYSITGSAATLLEDYNLNAEAGSYAITGVAVTFEITGAGKDLIAEEGSYTLTGFSAQLAFGDIFSVDLGSYASTGSDANLAIAKIFSVNSGSYNLSGANAILLADFVTSANAGSYALTGSDAEFVKETVITAEPGAYTLTGSAATFIEDYVLTTDAGSYDITGFTAELYLLGDLSADPGSYDITGFDALVARGYLLNAEPATEYVDPGYVDAGYVIQTGYYVNGFDVTMGYPKFPLPNQVLSGVVYGPNGNDYVGTYVCPPGGDKQILYIFDD